MYAPVLDCSPYPATCESLRKVLLSVKADPPVTRAATARAPKNLAGLNMLSSFSQKPPEP
jgi:hypothetical protein